MATRRKPPQETLKINRLPKVGDKITVTFEVTATGKLARGSTNTITGRLTGFPDPLTIWAGALKDPD